MHPLTQSTSTESLPIHWVEILFEKMALTYGKRFTDQWSGCDPEKLKAHWAKELYGYSRAELAHGYADLNTREWPPTLPEFKRLCRTPIDPLVAYHEALNGICARERGETFNWSHPAVFWAITKIGAFDLKSQNYPMIKTRWEKALQEELAQDSWLPIPEPAVALPSPSESLLSKKEAARLLAELKTVLHCKQMKFD